ncbi:hypothetical protein Arno18_37 [Pectobacterium phage Arno18]|uniref:Uncharacterized protein n=1 Tax=Pectobacterium phage Arno18 TaxID=2500578 RepID=A0A678ZXF1_9CAUD|nr:hypothetical protein Arno18_37 [Pectobacterium phage Arno18]
MKIKSSKFLHSFYKDWLAWVEAGATEHPYQGDGLCSCLHFYCKDTLLTRAERKKVTDEMSRQFTDSGLDRYYPFNKNNVHYSSEGWDKHLNVHRITWVRDRIADGVSE